MKKYIKSHEEYAVSPLTISPNHNAWSSEVLKKLLDGKKVGVNTFCVHRDQGLVFYADGKAWDIGSNYLLKKIKAEPAFVSLVEHKSEMLTRQLLAQIRSIEGADLNKWSNHQLISFFKKTYRTSCEYCAYGYIPVLSDHLFNKFTNLLKECISRHFASFTGTLSLPEVFTILATPTKFIPSKKARLELLKIILSAKDIVSDRGIKRWHQNWHWVNFGQLGPDLGWGDYLADAQKLKNNIKQVQGEINSLSSSSLDIKKQQRALMRQLNFTKEEIQLFSVAQTFTYLKGLRMEILFGVYSSWSRVLDVIAKRLYIPKKLLYYCSVGEIVDWLKDNKSIDIKILQERKKFCVWVAHAPERQTILTGPVAQTFLKKHVVLEKNADVSVSVIHGTVAASGYAKGPVKIVNKTSEIYKVEVGDILVSVATNPTLLPAMAKAAAFVTDAGGITSHAAIVAREMNKPCIIGTKIATQVLKDGDIVEVDTKSGNIRKL